MLGLLGFYNELDYGSEQPNGSIRDAVRPVGEPDEADLVAYLDAGHELMDVLETQGDVLTGMGHRHSVGCSSLMTDGAWLWRQDFPHYLETHHVSLPEEFLRRVRRLDYRMPAVLAARFAPLYDRTMPLVGWSSAVPWRSTEALFIPETREVISKARFEAAIPTGRGDRPQGRWDRPRKRGKR
ncbi:hypothetical protein [Streptomyces sp. NPDC094049]|uniref:hypothetical protein n=1 Tax=Streptomyces sp. NPDC094049 TaxID=3154987 RepID=UPI00333480D8